MLVYLRGYMVASTGQAIIAKGEGLASIMAVRPPAKYLEEIHAEHTNLSSESVDARHPSLEDGP